MIVISGIADRGKMYTTNIEISNMSVTVVKIRMSVYLHRTSPLRALLSEIHSGTSSFNNVSCSSTSPADVTIQCQNPLCRHQLSNKERL